MLFTLLKPLFTSKARISVLALFFAEKENMFYVREIVRKTGEHINAVRRELEKLQNSGVVISKNFKNKKYFKLNSSYFFYAELSSLFEKASLPALDIAEKIYRAGGNIDYLLLSGQFVNLLKNESVIDILIVGNVNKSDVECIISAYTLVDFEIRFAVLSTQEFLEKIDSQDEIIVTILKEERNIIPINTILFH